MRKKEEEIYWSKGRKREDTDIFLKKHRKTEGGKRENIEKSKRREKKETHKERKKTRHQVCFLFYFLLVHSFIA